MKAHCRDCFLAKQNQGCYHNSWVQVRKNKVSEMHKKLTMSGIRMASSLNAIQQQKLSAKLLKQENLNPRSEIKFISSKTKLSPLS